MALEEVVSGVKTIQTAKQALEQENYRLASQLVGPILANSNIPDEEKQQIGQILQENPFASYRVLKELFPEAQTRISVGAKDNFQEIAAEYGDEELAQAAFTYSDTYSELENAARLLESQNASQIRQKMAVRNDQGKIDTNSLYNIVLFNYATDNQVVTVYHDVVREIGPKYIQEKFVRQRENKDGKLEQYIDREAATKTLQKGLGSDAQKYLEFATQYLAQKEQQARQQAA